MFLMRFPRLVHWVVFHFWSLVCSFVRVCCWGLVVYGYAG